MNSSNNKSAQKIKLCCITNNVRAGGAGKSLLILVRELAKLLPVSILSRSNKIPEKFSELSAFHYRIRSGFYPLHYLSGARAPFPINYIAWFFRCFFIANTLSILKSINPDVVLINGFQGVWYLPFLSKRQKKILYVRELLDMSRFDSRYTIKLINKYVDYVICITENERQNLPELNCPVTVVFNSYEEDINAGEGVGILNGNHDDIRIGIFGTIQQAKGQYLLLNLLEKYRDEIDRLKIKFYVYGGKSTFTTRKGGQEKLIAAVKRNKWEKYFEFPGWVENVGEVMRDLDVVLRTDTSGCPWGRDIIEAMSNARPVIAAGQSQVFIKNHESGILYQPNNIESMWQAISEVCSSRDKRFELGQNALTFARNNFDASRNAASIYDILKQL